MSRMSEIHADLTALRAVDACGGIYTPAEEASGFAAGHRAALGSAMVSVGAVDGLAAEMFAVLYEMFCDGPVDVAFAGNPLAIKALEDRAHAVIAKATGSEAA